MLHLRLPAASLAWMLAPMLALGATGAWAQAFPARPIRLVVGFTPGGGVDINARMLAGKMSEILGQQVVVDNKPGAGTNIANEFVARAAPDGYTLLINTAAVAINMSLYKSVAFDTLRDFAPVSVFSESQNIMVTNAARPYRTAADVVAAARARPGALTYSSAGSGSTQNLAGELFKLKTRTDLLHVPYKGSAAAMADLVAGVVTFSPDTTASSMGQIQAKKLKPLAVAAARRALALPGVPTTAEAGFGGVEIGTWYGLFGPPGLPRGAIDKWQQDVARVLQLPDVRARIVDLGGETGGNKPEEFAAYIRNEYARMGKLVKDADVRPE